MILLMRAKNDTGTCTNTVSYDNSNNNNINGSARTHTVPIPLSYFCKREKERERENELIIDYCTGTPLLCWTVTILVVAHHTGNYPILHMLTCIHGWTANPSRGLFSRIT